MTKTVFYLPNHPMLDQVLADIKERIPCFVEREYIEMDFSKVTITFRNEDAEWVLTTLSMFTVANLED